jgi:hypothetical protein
MTFLVSNGSNRDKGRVAPEMRLTITGAEFFDPQASLHELECLSSHMIEYPYISMKPNFDAAPHQRAASFDF